VLLVSVSNYESAYFLPISRKKRARMANMFGVHCLEVSGVKCVGDQYFQDSCILFNFWSQNNTALTTSEQPKGGGIGFGCWEKIVSFVSIGFK